MSVRRACEGRPPAAPRKVWKREAGTSSLPALMVPRLAYTLCWSPPSRLRVKLTVMDTLPWSGQSGPSVPIRHLTGGHPALR